MSDPSVSSQLAVGKVTVVPFPDYNMLVWSGTDDNHSLNLATAAIGTDFPSASTGLSGNADTALDGPAVAVLPSGTMAYIAWVGSGGQICITTATPGGGTVPTWITGEIWTIDNSTARSAPTVAFGTQNQHLVLNVVWQDGSADSMVLAQLLLGDEANSLAFCSLGRSCTGTPSLSRGPGGSYLAWASGPSSDGLYTLNLANDPRGGVNFDFGAALSHMGTACEYGMLYVPLGPSHGYAVYANPKGVYATQIGRNQYGDWTVNTAPGTNVTVAGGAPAGPANASPGRTLVNGATQPAITVVWPGTYGGSPANSILSASFKPVVAAIPVTQYVIA